MLVVKKVVKNDIPKIVEFMMLTMIPYCSDDREKLQVIDYANRYIKDYYQNARLIIYNFKLVGAYLINDGSLDLLYIERKYRFKGIGRKILKKVKRKIKEIKVVKGNENAVMFLKKNDYKIVQKKNNLLIFRRVVDEDDE